MSAESILSSHTLYNTSPFSFNGRVICARVVDVYDGDTITAVTDAGAGTFTQIRVRLMHIDTPEMRGGTPESKRLAVAARDRLVQLITGRGDLSAPMTKESIQQVLNTDRTYIVYIKCSHHDKFGRVLGEIFTNSAASGVSLNAMLLREGHAKPYEGKNSSPRKQQCCMMS